MEKLITKCVLQNVIFYGTAGSAYSVQDLVHTANLNTINKFWKAHKKELAALDTDSLFKNPSTAKKSLLQLQVDTLEAVFQYKQEQAEKAAELAKRKEERVRTLATLKQIRTEKELDELKQLNLEDIDAKIAELEV